MSQNDLCTRRALSRPVVTRDALGGGAMHPTPLGGKKARVAGPVVGRSRAACSGDLNMVAWLLRSGASISDSPA